MKKILVYDSPLNSASGYGEHAREIATYLTSYESDIDLYFIDSPWGKSQKISNPNETINNILKKPITEELVGNVDVYIKVGLPSEFIKLGKRNIGITSVVESTLCHESFLHGCNNMDCVIVPSEFNKTTLHNSFTHHNILQQTEIKVVQQCVDYVEPEEKTTTSTLDFMEVVNEEFCFLYNAKWNKQIDRKNIETLIRTFIVSFKDVSDKPALILKTHLTNYSEKDYQKTQKYIKEILSDCNIEVPSIYLLHGHLTHTELKQLYTHDKIKCGINISSGESFGRPVLETICAGKPMIISNWSAPTEYLKNDLFHVSGELVDNPLVSNTFIKGGKWFGINTDSVIEKLKDVFGNYEKYQVEINNTLTDLADKHTKKYISTRYKEIIDSYL